MAIKLGVYSVRMVFVSSSLILSLFSSESSMFVAKDHIVMKTCGKTKLLNCVEPLLELTQVYLGIASIQVGNLFAAFYTITIVCYLPLYMHWDCSLVSYP